MAYWALAEVVRQRLQVAEDDDSAVAAARLTEGLVRWVPDPGDREYIGLRLARLLGVSGGGDAGPALGREELFAGWRRFFERLASTAPVTLLIEDLHSASSDLLDFLDHLVDWSRDLPIFVLAFARSELEAQRPGFGTGHNRVTIALDPLDEASMDAIVDALVPDMPPAARQRITERAQGIPLYAMESIRSLIDSGVIQRDPAGSHRLIGGAAAIGELAVPDSLRALLAARLDALDPVARRVVADASVLGARFPAEALVALSGLDETEASGVLAGLLRREVLQVSADPLSPQRGSYGFTQEMLRQVAYDTLSRRDRKSRHLAVARHLRTVFPNDGEEVIDAVARHYQDALDAEPRDPDAPEIRQVLVETLVRAAERSIRTGAPTRAAEAYVAAADQVTDSDPLRAANLLMCAASTSTRAVDQGPVTDIAERARVLAAGVGERRLEAAATALLGRARRRQGRFAEARDLLNTALSVLRTDPGPDTLEALDALGPLEVHAGTPAAAGVLEEAMALANRLGADDARFADILLHYGLYFHFQGNLRLAALYQRGAIGHYEAAGATYESIYAYINLADVLLVQDARASIEASLRALELSVQTGATYPLGRTVYNLACAHLQLDDWDLADAALHHPRWTSSLRTRGCWVPGPSCTRCAGRSQRPRPTSARSVATSWAAKIHRTDRSSPWCERPSPSLGASASRRWPTRETAWCTGEVRLRSEVTTPG